MPHSNKDVYGYLKLTNISLTQWCATITDQQQTVGRSSQVEIVIPAKYSEVSRQHARVWHDKKGCWICDVGSTFGTTVNGIKINPNQPCMIVAGDRIRFGQLEVHYIEVTEAKDELKEKPRKEPESGAVTGFGPIPDRKTEKTRVSTKNLTHAELRIVILIRRGVVTLDELAAALHRSPNTVRTQLESIYKKLDVHSRHELIGKILADNEK